MKLWVENKENIDDLKMLITKYNLKQIIKP